MCGIDRLGPDPWSMMYVGLGVAIIPAAITTVIACSKIIFVNIIANIAIRILTANMYRITVYGISFVEVPILWKISLYSAIAGGSLIALGAIVLAVGVIYWRCVRSKPVHQSNFDPLNT